MIPGFKGRLLLIDLTAKTSKTIDLPDEILKKYVGGRTLGAKLYWDLLGSDVNPLGPENIFMVLTGPLSGTMAPCGCKHVIVTRSPATGTWLDTYSSGRVAPELKYAGFDGLIVIGRADRPTCLLINDEQVTFEDAAPLWGRGSFHAESYLKKHFHPEAGVLAIGQAGENLLGFACVGSEFFRKAGRGGAGAVMGAKNLKAIAVKGSGGVACADVSRVYDLIRKHHAVYLESPIGKARHRYGTALTLNITHPAGMLPTRNFSDGQFDRAIGTIDKDGVADHTIADRACFGCFLACSKLTYVKDGVFAGTKLEGPEYESIGLLGSNLGVDYLPAVIKANYLCDDLGMDTISAGGVIGFAMECYEKGILTKEDTGGLELNFGNYMAAVELLELMAVRKDFGAFCAKGVRDMARELGPEAEAFAIHCKGLEFPAYDPRAGWGSTITYSTTARGGCHRRAWPPLKEVLGGVDPFTTKNKDKVVLDMMTENCIMHSILVCDFPGKFIPLSNQDWGDYFNAVTGLEYSEDDLMKMADMAETLIRKINLRHGFTAADDILPKRILEEPLASGPPAGKIVGKERFLQMRGAYYRLRGWDEQGVPTRETCDRFGFEEDAVFRI